MAIPIPEPTILHGTFPTWLQVVIILLSSLVAAKVIEVIGYRIAEDWGSNETIRTVFFEEVTLPLYLTVFLYGVLISVQLFDVSPTVVSVENVLVTVLVIAWSRGGLRFGNRALDLVKERDKSYEFAPVLKNIWSVFIVIVAFISILVIWEIDITPLLASAGVIGIVIGFAARDAVANFIGGIALYFDDTYKLGDFVLLESGEKGTVVDIGLRSTTLLTRDRVMVTVPNSLLNSSQVVNESAPQRYKRIRIPFSVAYGTDTNAVESIAMDIADEATHVKRTPTPQLHFDGFGESGIEYELRAYVPHPTREPRARHQVNTALYNRFGEAGIEIPYPQRDVRMRDAAAGASHEAERTIPPTDGDADVTIEEKPPGD